jgi:hypothetical protein
MIFTGNNDMRERHLYLKYLNCRKRGRGWEEQVTGLSARLVTLELRRSELIGNWEI